MSGRGFFILCGITLTGLLAVVLFVALVAAPAKPVPPRPPELAGQKVPAKVYKIEFDKPYDLFCTFFRDETTVYRNCKILGFTGDAEEPDRTPHAAGSSGISFGSASGSASGAYYQSYFNHWLVLELSDGRRAYVPPEAIKYIETTPTKGR